MRTIWVLISATMVSLILGCQTEMATTLPRETIIYMPSTFEDSRLKTNPWRNDDDSANAKDPSIYIPRGPEYPYQLIYDPQTNNYEVVIREGASAVAGITIKYSRPATPYTIEVPGRE